MSFTHHEFQEASEKKIPRLIFLKTFPPEKAVGDNNPNLTELKNKITNVEQLLAQKFDDDEKLPALIVKALNTHVASFKEEIAKAKQEREEKQGSNAKNYTKVYLCDREEINQDLQFSVKKNKNPVQFYMLKGHENDLPWYFVERQKIEDADKDINSYDIRITPFFGDNITSYEDAEAIILSQIATKLKWKKQWGDISPEAIIQYMEGKIDHLFITWIIEIGVWKNEKFKGHILEFCGKFNANLETDRKILFFGILRHAEESGITLEQFYKLINDISWDKNLLFTKITKLHVSDWLDENDIASVNANADFLIQTYLNNISQNPLYFSEVENGLKKMIDHND